MESCSRTLHALPLLRPGHDSDEIFLGCLGRAAEYYDVDVYGFGCASSHVHLLYGAEHALQMAGLHCHINSNVAREIGRLHGHREKLWGRRYRPMTVGDDRESQRERLKYVLSQPVKDGLVEKVLQWPGPSAARALLHGEPLVGLWFDRTREYYARRKGIDFDKYDYATRYEIEIQRLPAFEDDSPDEYQTMIAELLGEIEEEGAAERKGRKVLGVEKILSQDPCQPLRSGTGAPAAGKKSPVPMLFFSKLPGVARGMADDYRDFLDEYMVGSARMIEAAERGYRLNPRRCLPARSFPPAVIESILQACAGFNPETAFPRGCFPRAWPFVGGELASPPPRPPTRDLVLEQVGEELKIVWRGEIPTVHVPRRPVTVSSKETTAPDHAVPIQETQLVGGEAGRAPP